MNLDSSTGNRLGAVAHHQILDHAVRRARDRPESQSQVSSSSASDVPVEAEGPTGCRWAHWTWHRTQSLDAHLARITNSSPRRRSCAPTPAPRDRRDRGTPAAPRARDQLDQCWDLLRQRRALRETGGDPVKQACARPTRSRATRLTDDALVSARRRRRRGRRRPQRPGGRGLPGARRVCGCACSSGRTTSVARRCRRRRFPVCRPGLSRYSYLVSLLPSRIVDDLGAHVRLARRPILLLHTGSLPPGSDRAAGRAALDVRRGRCCRRCGRLRRVLPPHTGGHRGVVAHA